MLDCSWKKNVRRIRMLGSRNYIELISYWAYLMKQRTTRLGVLGRGRYVTVNTRGNQYS